MSSDSDSEAKWGCLIGVIGGPILFFLCIGAEYILSPIREFAMSILPIVLVAIVVIAVVYYMFKDA
ncbi:MAG: hypothetical protein E7131_04555 [Rikenellaceae bacterium]|nr:hypothetical protein [Rikenellaceae bacterium]